MPPGVGKHQPSEQGQARSHRQGVILKSRSISCRRVGLTDDRQDSATIRSWDNYWQHTQSRSAYSGGGATHPAVRGFWDEVFAAARAEFDNPRLADIASGSGAVADAARGSFGISGVRLTCVDVSEAAIAALQKRLPEVTVVVADARDIPLAPASFELVCSQFGIEYAGLDAVRELLRLVRPGGQAALLLHHRGGGIFRQCNASLDAVRQLQDADFIGKTAAMFVAGFRMLREGSREEYESAAGDLMPAIRSMESIMRQHGRQVADGAVLKLYTDVRTMAARLPNYDEREVAEWLARMRGEFSAYEGRMASMCEAAVDESAFASLCADVEAAGFELQRREALLNTETDIPLAWALIAAAHSASSAATASG